MGKRDAQGLRAFTAFTEDPSSVTSIHVEQLTAASSGLHNTFIHMTYIHRDA